MNSHRYFLEIANELSYNVDFMTLTLTGVSSMGEVKFSGVSFYKKRDLIEGSTKRCVDARLETFKPINK